VSSSSWFSTAISIWDLKSACHFKLPSLGCRNCRGKRYAMESVYRVTQRASRERRRMYGLGAYRAQRSGARDFLADGGDLASGRGSIGARSARLLHPRTLEVRPPRGDRMSVCPSDGSFFCRLTMSRARQLSPIRKPERLRQIDVKGHG
jgi:hypothetical protein